MHWDVLWQYRWELLSGLTLTCWLSAAAIVLSTLVGVPVGALWTTRHFYLSRAIGLVIEIMRNVPAVVKLFFLHFVIGMDAIPAGLLTLVIHQSAYIADVTVAGLRSIPSGQREGALACGHSDVQVFRYVLLPQAMRVMIPPLTTQYVQIVKNSAVVMLVAVEDLSFQTQFIEQQTFRGFEAATATTVMYIILVLLISSAMSLLARRLSR